MRKAQRTPVLFIWAGVRRVVCIPFSSWIMVLLAHLPLLFLAATVSADATLLTVPLTRKASGSLQGLAKQERLRFGGKAYSPTRRAVPAKYSLWAFYATIGIGSPVSAVNCALEWLGYLEISLTLELR